MVFSHFVWQNMPQFVACLLVPRYTIFLNDSKLLSARKHTTFSTNLADSQVFLYPDEDYAPGFDWRKSPAARPRNP